MKIELSIENCFFYSSGDESLFFDGLNRLKAIKNIKGYGRVLTMDILLAKINQESLRDLMAILKRYNIPLKSIKGLALKKNYSWLHHPQAYWHNDFF
jgi:hypothetical protein